MKKSDGKGNNLSSPYYLHPSDHPGMNICPVVFKGDNYEEWARSMCNAFLAKRKQGFLEGKYPKPTDDSEEIEDWWSVNSMLVAWIFQSIEPTLRSTITYYDTMKELWEDLKQRFFIGNGPHLAKCKQDGQSIAGYFGRMKVIWEELSNYVKPPMCTCGKYTCNLVSEWDKQLEAERVHQFLMGLDDDVYGTIRSNIIAQEPLPPLNRTYALIIQEERHRALTRTRDVRTEAVSFTVQGPKSAPSSATNVVCKSCGKPVHEINSCFKIIGYPEWWSTGRGKGSERGRNTNSTGHGKGKSVVANAAQTVNTFAATGTSTVLTPQDKASLASTLTDDQWATILAMANSQDKGISKEKLSSQWILDSGASHHMTGNKHLLVNLVDILPTPIGLPNGTCTNAVKKGSVILGDKLRLNHVLYVPQLSCNLISLASLINDLHYLVTLTDKVCVIQDRTSRTLIGVAAYDNPVTRHSPSPLDLSNTFENGSENTVSTSVGPANDREMSLDPHQPQDLDRTSDDRGSPSRVLRRSERYALSHSELCDLC
ncbi:hypothetical protein Salat_1719500 [Sesamum alatum]|uniref:Retrotransposon Copia-like N-terminal domain-containing protein n=1 Tax=Sesamum alatum TaxID=300844 RepID=A0AAE2CK90_9LAMI|nr:hypothetical protein Salat_1719500 [Sesamum alatum]